MFHGRNRRPIFFRDLKTTQLAFGSYWAEDMDLRTVKQDLGVDYDVDVILSSFLISWKQVLEDS